MKIIIFLISAMVLTIHGKPFSLMTPEYNQSQNTGTITLNGVIFLSDKQWIIWLNNQKITPERIPDWLRVTKITEAIIHCDYLYKGIWHHLTLEPYDTFTPPLIKAAAEPKQ